MGVEFELKYSADAGKQEGIARRYADLCWKTFQMRTAYYDTPSGALSARHITLRCRMENGLPVCTVKTPEKGGRGEWEISGCESIEKAVPALCALGAPEELMVLCREGLVHICGAEFTRRAALVTWEGTKMELALDSGFLVAGERKTPLCEVEVELKDGDYSKIVAWAMTLAYEFGLKPEEKSKFRRALALREAENG